MESLKIAMVSDWYFPKLGGVSIHLHNLALKMREKGHEVVIITNKCGKTNKDLKNASIPLIKINGFVVKNAQINVSVLFKSIKSDLLGYDVIHGHSISSILSLKAMREGRFLDTSTFITTHTSGYGGGITEKGLMFFGKPLLKRYLICADKIIAVSSSAGDFVKKFSKKDNIIIIPNGINPKVFYPRENKEEIKEKYGIPKDKPIVLFVGRLEWRKGIHILLKAMKGLDALLLIVGKGELEGFLKAYAKKLRIKDKVIFMKEQMNGNLPEIYSIADIFVLPSLIEAFGIVLLEAMATEVPVIGTNVGGIPEIIEDGKTGLLVKPNDPFDLRNAINKLLSDENLRKRMGKAGRKEVLSNYSWDIVAEKVEAAYRCCIDEKNSA